MNKTANSVDPRISNGTWIIWTVILSICIIALVLASFIIVKNSITDGVNEAKGSFSDSYGSAYGETYNAFKDTAYNIAENANHVSNDVSITIATAKGKSDLEVLKVSDVVYIIADSDDTKNGTVSWLKVSGTGLFTVNLTAAEYLVDNNRKYVLIRVPTPVLDSQSISIDSFEQLYFHENKWKPTNSVKSGESLAKSQLNEAQQRIQEDFMASEYYSKLAISSADSMISVLVKSLNADIPDLQVEVEFYDFN